MAYRILLSDDVVPDSYDLTLEPDLDRFTFAGTVKITCQVNVAVDTITLHAKELAFWEASFEPCGEGGTPLGATGITFKPLKQTVAFAFEEPLPTGAGVLKVKFSGILNDQMAGFYRSHYTRADGTKAHMAVTQFEAVDARRCFPCWDEPGRKAVFTITLIVPADLTALSNMPEALVEFLPGRRKRVTFLPSPKMSTYLLAVVVGELESLQTVTSSGTLVRVMCVPGRLSQGQYALDCAVRALEFYNEFFALPFPLPKLDMAAIPDFASGAMENWGLVTYREMDLLCDLATVSTSTKQRIAVCTAHELAHQWFGNLVTMQWWDDLWLNEGFACWMETFAVDHLVPEWKVWEIFVGSDQQAALGLDGLRTSHPIQVPIANAEEVEEVFDSISYCKGGSLVRMLYAVLGHDDFRKGLQAYFRRYAHGNTETIDLARTWEEVSGKPIKELVESWTAKMGYPLLRVLADPFENGGALEVEQQWFLADGSVQPGDDAVTWMVPLLLGGDGPTPPPALSLFREKTTRVPMDVKGATWLKMNFGQEVPCRVMYPPSLMQRLSDHFSALPAVDRIGLLGDAFALCKAGQVTPTEVVTLLRGIGDEGNDKVWAQLRSILTALHRLLQMGFEPPVAEAYAAFAARLIRPHAERLGWDPAPKDDENTKRLRQLLVGLLAAFSPTEPNVWEQARPRYEAILSGAPNACSLDIRGSVLRIAVRQDGTGQTCERLIALHNGTKDGALQRDIYGALTEVPPSLYPRVLQWCISEDVRAQDTVWIPNGLAFAGREGPDAVFEWVQREYNGIYAKLGKTSMMLFADVVRFSGEGFVVPAKAEEVRAFWRAKPMYDVISKALNQTCEKVCNNAQFLERLRQSPLATAEYWAA